VPERQTFGLHNRRGCRGGRATGRKVSRTRASKPLGGTTSTGCAVVAAGWWRGQPGGGGEAVRSGRGLRAAEGMTLFAAEVELAGIVKTFGPHNQSLQPTA